MICTDAHATLSALAEHLLLFGRAPYASFSSGVDRTARISACHCPQLTLEAWRASNKRDPSQALAVLAGLQHTQYAACAGRELSAGCAQWAGLRPGFALRGPYIGQVPGYDWSGLKYRALSPMVWLPAPASCRLWWT